MAIAARKRFNISKKSVKNGIYSCPPLEGGSKSLISRRGTRAKRALNIVGIDKQNTGLIRDTNLFPCLGFAPRSQSLACCAYAQAGSICSLSGFAHFVRVIRPQIRYFLIPLFPLSERRLTHQFGTYTDAGLNAAKRQYAQNPCPIRLSAGGGGG